MEVPNLGLSASSGLGEVLGDAYTGNGIFPRQPPPRGPSQLWLRSPTLGSRLQPPRPLERDFYVSVAPRAEGFPPRLPAIPFSPLLSVCLWWLLLDIFSLAQGADRLSRAPRVRWLQPSACARPSPTPKKTSIFLQLREGSPAALNRAQKTQERIHSDVWPFGSLKQCLFLVHAGDPLRAQKPMPADRQPPGSHDQDFGRSI